LEEETMTLKNQRIVAHTAGEDLPLGSLVDIDLSRAQARFEIRYWGAVRAVRSFDEVCGLFPEPTSNKGPGKLLIGAEHENRNTLFVHYGRIWPCDGHGL
jgi:hypothetical protein